MSKKIFYQTMIFALLLLVGLGVSSFFSLRSSQAQGQGSLPTKDVSKTTSSGEKSGGFSSNLAGDPQDYFADYTSWPSSSARKAGDYLPEALYFLTDETTHSYRGPVDINGDGLMDILFSYRHTSLNEERFAVLLNTGNNNFELIYRCVGDTDMALWYGDCAAE